MRSGVAFRLCPCIQVRLGELDQTPPTIKSVDNLRRLFLPLFFLSLVPNARVFIGKVTVVDVPACREKDRTCEGV